MHFCFRIAEGEIGMTAVHLIDYKYNKTKYKYKVFGNKLKGLSGSRMNFGQYQMDAGFISWSRHEYRNEGGVSIWIRPGN